MQLHIAIEWLCVMSITFKEWYLWVLKTTSAVNLSHKLLAVVFLAGKTMDHLYGNGRKFASFLLTAAGPVLVIELQY